MFEDKWLLKVEEPLKYWIFHKAAYPHIYRTALQCLSTPASSCQSFFSKASISQKGCLKPSTIESFSKKLYSWFEKKKEHCTTTYTSHFSMTSVGEWSGASQIFLFNCSWENYKPCFWKWWKHKNSITLNHKAAFMFYVVQHVSLLFSAIKTK